MVFWTIWNRYHRWHRIPSQRPSFIVSGSILNLWYPDILIEIEDIQKSRQWQNFTLLVCLNSKLSSFQTLLVRAAENWINRNRCRFKAAVALPATEAPTKNSPNCKKLKKLVSEHPWCVLVRNPRRSLFCISFLVNPDKTDQWPSGHCTCRRQKDRIRLKALHSRCRSTASFPVLLPFSSDTDQSHLLSEEASLLSQGALLLKGLNMDFPRKQRCFNFNVFVYFHTLNWTKQMRYLWSSVKFFR